MNWTKKDWLDLSLMIIGACLGSALFELVIVPTSGHTLPGTELTNLGWSALAGLTGGYLLRFVVSSWRNRRDSSCAQSN